ncbi:hypothetical protein LPB90_18230 [Chryseobacterium sp. LC2016-29]|uniref:hypothetical protein n=1 Tax=Chryseobacterium sp. LC2016-29 TaxID=2897331 RepID=UPI001E2A88F1|nr:hypothetical protein [Chryseobacterium sp. LC2016-29]MCD0480380.1 hypothetical protein [Chryseobacterium sp. LC2016-29]
MKTYYLVFCCMLVLSCQSKEDKEKEALKIQVTNRADSLLIFSTKMTEEFLVNNKSTDCAEKKQKFKEVQKVYNEIAKNYRSEAELLQLPEDTIRYRLGMSNKVLQDQNTAQCVGLSKGYDQFQHFLTGLKLAK